LRPSLTSCNWKVIRLSLAWLVPKNKNLVHAHSIRAGAPPCSTVLHCAPDSRIWHRGTTSLTLQFFLAPTLPGVHFHKQINTAAYYPKLRCHQIRLSVTVPVNYWRTNEHSLVKILSQNTSFHYCDISPLSL